MGCRRFRNVRSKQPFKQTSWIGNRRQRLRFRLPSQVISVGARITVIAIACHSRFFQTNFQRRKLRLSSHHPRRNLISRYTQFQICACRSINLNIAHVASRRPAMITGTHQQWPTPICSQIRQHKNVVFHRLQRCQNLLQLTQPAFCTRSPIPHIHAVRHIEPSRSHRFIAANFACGKRRRHRIQIG